MENIGNILGYGIPSNIFEEKFNFLPEEKRGVLERIAHRVETITKLNHETLFLHNPDAGNLSRLFFLRWELPSIQIYLYCTCIDTLASKIDGKYLDFYQWLKRKDAFTLNSGNIDDFHEKYLEEYGDKRNFSRLFERLQPSIKSWLNQNVVVQPSNQYKIPSNRDEKYLLTYLSDYFYKAWRNPFTHRSISNPVDFVLDISSYNEAFSQANGPLTLIEQEWFRQPASFKLDKDEFSLWHKKEIDLTIILRIIIQAVVFNWLELDITNDIINTIIYRLHRLYWLYSYIHETKVNAGYLEAWKVIRENYSSDYISSMRNSGVLQLSLIASSKLIEFLHGQNPFEEQQREYLREYIECITKINIQIEFFNKEHPRLEKYNAEIEDKTKEEIKDFLTGLTMQKEYMEIIKNSRAPWRFWELINNNSEYESIDMDY